MKTLKYYTVFETVKQRIAEGLYTGGTLIPSETQLMNEFSVSRITVRSALSMLENKGYIFKVQGKGCFVSERQKVQSLSRIHSYTQAIRDAGFVPTRKVLQKTVRAANEKEAFVLHIRAGEKVFTLERCIYADKNPLCVTTAVLPYTAFFHIERFDFKKESLYEVMENEYKLPVMRSVLELEACTATDKIASLLHINRGTPLLLYDSIAFSKNQYTEFPVEYCISYYLTDTIKYKIEQG